MYGKIDKHHCINEDPKKNSIYFSKITQILVIYYFNLEALIQDLGQIF